MDERRVKELVELAHRLAKRRKDAPRKLGRGTARRNLLLERAPGHIFRNNHEFRAGLIALGHTRQMPKAPPRALGGPQRLVRAAHAGGEVDPLAHKGPERGAVHPTKHHELSAARAIARAQRALHSVGTLPRHGGKVELEVIGLLCLGIHGAHGSTGPRRSTKRRWNGRPNRRGPHVEGQARDEGVRRARTPAPRPPVSLP